MSSRPALTVVPFVFALLVACASPGHSPDPFVFERDTLAFPNDLYASYGFDEEGRWRLRPSEKEIDFGHRCFVMLGTVHRFFRHARFEPGVPALPAAELEPRLREILGRSPRRFSAEDERVPIPGYPGLRAFSAAHESLLKELGGGAWRSYVLRSHWRMVIPFSRRHQERTAAYLRAELAQGRPPSVHLVKFPKITVNHGVVVYGMREREHETIFEAYDPNDPSRPTELVFEHDRRTFWFPRNTYHMGGPIDVYAIYHHPLY